jgi:hypothetical protein
VALEVQELWNQLRDAEAASGRPRRRRLRLVRGAASRYLTLFGLSLVVGVLAVVASGCGGSGRSHAGGSEASRVSPCGSVSLATAWSSDGKQVAWFGYRWPPPPNHHAVGSYNTLRAICVSAADGKQLQPLRYTTCSEHCSRALSDPPDQLEWPAPALLLYGNDLGIFALSVGKKPRLVGKKPPEPFSADSAGDRVAAGFSTCPRCAGPVTVLDVASGSVVGRLGGKKLDNVEPSLSPDGTQVVFVRNVADDSGRTKGIWIAAADGSRLRRLEPSGAAPSWSPAGSRIAFLPRSGGVKLVSAQGGASATLLRSAPGAVSLFGWSPDGRRIAVNANGRLAVVDVTTRKVRQLLKLQPPYGPSSVAWSPSSRQLLVVWRPSTGSKCPSGLWRVPVDGAKPRLVHGC